MLDCLFVCVRACVRAMRLHVLFVLFMSCWFYNWPLRR